MNENGNNTGIAIIFLLILVFVGGAILKTTMNSWVITVVLIGVCVIFVALAIIQEEEDFTSIHQYEW